MAAEQLPLLTSKNSRQREQGLLNLFEAFATCRDVTSTNGRGLSALFASILHHDPNPDIRVMVLGHPLCPLDTLCATLLDSHSTVRRTAAETLYKRTLSSDQAISLAPKLLTALALETHDSNIVTLMQVLQLMHIRFSNALKTEIILNALGHSEISFKAEDVCELPVYYATIRDVTESDSLLARRALAPLLVAVMKSASMPGRFRAQDGLHILQLSFQILETLLRDVYRPVQMAAVDALYQVPATIGYHDLKKIGRLSDQSVKCVLRIAKVPVETQVDHDTRRVLDLLTFYPFATLSGYTLAEKFLRHQWYQARVAIVQRSHGRSDFSGFVRDKLVKIMQSNSSFAQVLDLRRGLSDKSGWITPHQVQ